MRPKQSAHGGESHSQMDAIGAAFTLTSRIDQSDDQHFDLSVKFRRLPPGATLMGSWSGRAHPGTAIRRPFPSPALLRSCPR